MLLRTITARVGQTESRPLPFIPFVPGRPGTALWKVLQPGGQETGRVGWRWMKIHLSTCPNKEMLAGRIPPSEKGSICGGVEHAGRHKAPPWGKESEGGELNWSGML